MAVFVDTSAPYALLGRDDAYHLEAAEAFRHPLAARERPVTRGHVVESVALVQGRLGLEAARALGHDLRGVIPTVPGDGGLHPMALTALLASRRKDLSLVDWTSFFSLRERGLRKALAFDEGFGEQGFSPASG